MIIALITVSILLVIREYFFYVHNQAWQQERKDLYNRIQAASYVEYKSLEDKPKEKKEETEYIEYV